MNLRLAAVATLVLLSGSVFAQDAAAVQDASIQSQRVTEGDTLLIERVQEENASTLPARGMSMQEVEAKFGAPGDKLDPRGGQKRQWPAIHRWSYPTFTVYFEKNRVIDAVANKAGTDEVGPKPAIR